MKPFVIIAVVTGVVCITAIEITALLNGINGVALSAAIGSIAAVLTGAPSYLAGKLKGKKEVENDN